MADLITWAKAQRKLMEIQAQLAAKDLSDREIVELSVAFPYYVQNEVHKVGDIRRDPETEQVKRCVTEYDGSVQTDWTIKTGTLWYAYHGIDENTAYEYVAPTGVHDQYKQGEWMTYNGAKYECLQDTVYSPDDLASAWLKHE